MASSRQIIDLSANNLTLNIDGKVIKDFMDDANPLEFQDVDLANIDFSCNGAMCRTMKPACVIFSVTVIPGSESYTHLLGIWKKCFSNDGRASHDDTPLVATLSCTGSGNTAKNVKLRMRKGTCIGGTPGVGVSSSGKMGGATFSFAFAQVG